MISESVAASISARWGKRILLLVCLISFLSGVLLTYQHVAYKNDLYASLQRDLQKLTVNAATQIDAILAQAIASAESLADRLTRGEIRKDEVTAALKEMLEANPKFHSGSVTFKPFGYDPGIRLYSPYYSRLGPYGMLKFTRLDQIYDYTGADYDWYTEPMAHGNRWVGPFWGEAGKTYLTTYSALFYSVDPVTGARLKNGVVVIAISMKQIKDIIESLNIGPSGFGALTTREGNYLYHPDYSYVRSHKNIKDVAKEKGDADRLELAARAARGEGGVIDHVSTTTGQASWLIFTPVPISGWSLQNTFIKDDLQMDMNRLRQQIVWIAITAIVFLASLSMLLLRAYSGDPARLWAGSAILSLLLLVGIGVVWDLALAYHAQIHDYGHTSARESGKRVSDKMVLNTLMNYYDEQNLKRSLPASVYIPTGIYIDTMELNGANTVSVAGQIWQKYPEDFPADIKRGFRIGSAKNTKIVETDSYRLENSVVVHWLFQADLRTQFDYSRYPLEIEHVGIQIQPLESDRNVFLVPDLGSYKMIAPTLKPGLDAAIFPRSGRLPTPSLCLSAVTKTPTSV